MRKRKTTSGKYWLISLILFCRSFTVSAYSAEDLYRDCGMSFTSPYNTKDLEIIRNYNFAKRYVSMYRYVSSSEYDESIITNRIEECEKTVEEIENELLNGYDKSVDKIYQLEADYEVAKQQLEDAKNTVQSVELKTSRLSSADIPTHSQYVQAMNRKKMADLNCNLGTESKPVPTMQAYLIKDYTKTSITYTTISGGGVVTLYNGVVAAVGENHVTINHHNGIVTSYKGLTPTVKVGDTVIQGNPIGITNGEFSVKLKINETLIDIYKLLEVSDEDI